MVPRFYLAEFAGPDERVHCLEVRTGARFAASPTKICVEMEAYSIMESGVLDKSCDRINTQIEGPVSGVFAKIHPGIDLHDEHLAREVFTHLLAFTANLIARSRIPRNERNAQLKHVSDFLRSHPDLLQGFDDDRYLYLLRNPGDYREVYDKIPILGKLAPILTEHKEQNPGQTDADETAASLDELTEILYPLLAPILTQRVAATILEVRAQAALLRSESINFITSDDPVIYLREDIRVQGRQIPDREIWTDPRWAVFMPLKPRVALYWNANENYELKTVGTDRVTHLNQQVMANCVRQVFAASPNDFPV